MANTKHGWHIPGTEAADVHEFAINCKGPAGYCPDCIKDMVEYLREIDRQTAMANHPSFPKTAEEVRTTSETGGEKGVKPERYSLIPVEALDILARLYGFGERKYAAHNWRKGYEWSKSYDSLQRHATAFWRGEDLDAETGLPHLAGVIFHAMTLIIFMEEQPNYDDRYLS